MRTWIAALLFMTASQIDAQELETIVVSGQSNTKEVSFSWGESKKLEKVKSRVTGQDNFQININGFNFVRFGIRHDTKLEEVPSYKALVALWTQVPALETESRRATASSAAGATFLAAFR